MLFRHFTLFFAATVVGISLHCLADTERRPTAAEIQSAVQSHFTKGRRQPKDLISREEVKALLKTIANMGWEIEGADAMLAETLPESHRLVRTLRTKPGLQFMRRVSGYKMIYDRLDRISEVPGGQRLVQDLVKLPDGHRYAKMNTGGGVPDLLALLPKTRNGKKRRVPDFGQPTGKLYTPIAVARWIQERYEQVD